MSAGLPLRVAEAVARHALWAPGQRVAVAVSGGVDSLVLLDVLVRTARLHGGGLLVATVDHGTRPSSAEAADAVAAFAESRGIPWVRLRASLGASASEAACRAVRLAWLDALPVDRIALAHHADDRAETVLLGLLRGHGARGLASLGWRAGRRVRPLLDEPKASLRAWARHAGLPVSEDPTNADPRWLRNRVRNELLPLAESLRPGARAALARSAAHLAEDDAVLEALAAPLGRGPWSVEALTAAPPALARRALLAGLPDATSAHLDAILDGVRRGRGRVRVSRDVAVVVADGTVRTMEVSSCVSRDRGPSAG